MKIGMVQFAGRQDKDANISEATDMVCQASNQGAQIVCLHELSNTIYFCFEENDRYFKWAEPIPGPTTEHFSAVARERELVLVVPLFESVGSTEFYNSAAVIGPDGELIGKYRKSSIPLIRRTGKTPTGFEKYYFKPGDLGFPVFPTPLGINIGVIICFDRHFPEHFRALALDGAQLICVPTTTRGTRDSAWIFELQAAAHNNGCWVAGVNRVGADEEADDFGPWTGHSILVNPQGQIVAEASETEDEVMVTEFDPAEAYEAQQAWGFFRDRRPEMYARLVK
jgi:N-carbamoylputrescine amidase